MATFVSNPFTPPAARASSPTPPWTTTARARFSPTDLCATALASCAMTIIGIYGKMHDVDVTGTSIEVTKTMSANPRRIGKLEVVFTMPDREYTDKQKTMIERAAHTCPVHLSLHPDVEQVFTFHWKR
ncbi:MAG: OsmC family protein [Bilophila wadsworthia]